MDSDNIMIYSPSSDLSNGIGPGAGNNQWISMDNDS